MEMDKTTLRILLAVVGVLLLLGIYLWDRWKRRRRALEETLETLDASLPQNEFELEEIDTISINPVEESAPVDADVLEAERSQLAPERQAHQEQPDTDQSASASSQSGQTVRAEQPSAARRANLPEVIQVSVVAPTEQPFQGAALAKAFADLGLKYGDMEIFHSYQGGEIQFSVASLVKPGTFPAESMEDFQTRGVTLFTQPPMVSQPLEAFERMIATCHALAQRLGGSEWDDRRRPLTAVKISLWRRQLKAP